MAAVSDAVANRKPDHSRFVRPLSNQVNRPPNCRSDDPHLPFALRLDQLVEGLIDELQLQPGARGSGGPLYVSLFFVQRLP